MKERKYIKLRTDMYADTKFKIIDMKPERDMIHYVWTRFVTLAGKVNMEGDVYMSRKAFTQFTDGLWFEDFGTSLENNYLSASGDGVEIYNKTAYIPNEAESAGSAAQRR